MNADPLDVIASWQFAGSEHVVWHGLQLHGSACHYEVDLDAEEIIMGALQDAVDQMES